MLRTNADISEVLGRVRYKNWKFRVEFRGEDPETGDILIQPVFFAPDNEEGGTPVEQKGRKWFVSRYSCDTEIVQTCWAAIKRAELHEMQEQFTYRNAAVFNNHISVERLARSAWDTDGRSE